MGLKLGMKIIKLNRMGENHLKLAKKVLQTLTPREEKILKLRLEGYTLEQVGYEFGLTRQRIHQIEPRIYRKLKHPSRSREIRRILKLADKDIWQRLLKQQRTKTTKNLVDRRYIKHLARGVSGDEREKFIYIHFFIEILHGGTPGWLFENSRNYKKTLFTRGSLDENKIDNIITEVTKSNLNSKQLYKILKRTHFPPKMIIDLHKLILNLSKEHHDAFELYGRKVNYKFFIDCCKNIFALDNPDNWK